MAELVKGCVQAALTPWKHTGTSILFNSRHSDSTCPSHKSLLHHSLAVFSMQRSRGEPAGTDGISVWLPQPWARQQPHSCVPHRQQHPAWPPIEMRLSFAKAVEHSPHGHRLHTPVTQAAEMETSFLRSAAPGEPQLSNNFPSTWLMNQLQARNSRRMGLHVEIKLEERYF